MKPIMAGIKNFFFRIPLGTKFFTAALSLFIERFAIAFSWFLIWVAVFTCIWLSGYSSYVTTILFWLGCLITYFTGLKKLHLPTQSEIMHRVEASSLLKHRPLQGLQDTPISGRSDFWQLEKLRQRKLLAKLRHSKPELNLAKHDPYALRIAFILFISCSIFIAPQSWKEKIKSGLILPSSKTSQENSATFLQVQITPPTYSGFKPIVLSRAANEKISILPGSKIKAQIQTGWGQPVLKMGAEKLSMKQKNDSDLWDIETDIPQTEQIQISTYGITRFGQKIEWLKDTPPIIGWNGDVEILPTGEMKLPLKIADDFGIRKLTLRAILSPGETIPNFGAPLLIEKTVNISIHDSSIEIQPVFDATGHVWAGRHVSLLVEAEDYAGNVSDTIPLNMVLPQRDFHNPVAIVLASIRSDILYLRGSIIDTATAVEDVLFRPDLYKWDTIMTLGLRSVDGRLRYGSSKDDLESSAALLWSLALHMEDGRISETQNSLREALNNLQDALQKGASKTEIAERMQEVQQALVRHLQSISAKLQQNAQDHPIGGMQYHMNLDALAEFMQKLQNDLGNGDTQSAMQKLNQLQQLADQMGSSMAQGMPKDMQEDMQNLDQLQNITTQQRKLLDKTRQSTPEMTPTLSKEQKEIQSRTNEVSQKAKEPFLEQAGSEMKSSAAYLDQKDMNTDHQQKAIEYLEQASKSMQQKLQEKMHKMMGITMGASGSQDPLGRQGRVSDSKTEIPEGSARKKTDEIIRTLREREGDMKRPLDERNYYQRLLKQW